MSESRRPLRRASGARPRGAASARGATRTILGALLVAAVLLRLWNLDHGLPWAFNPDEELHFVPVAMNYFEAANPGYFENPPALSYLLHAVFRLRFAAGYPFDSGERLRLGFLDDPRAALLTARVVVALIGAVAVACVYWVGRRFYDARVGLVAAALVGFAFLPTYYSKQALNDVATLVPVSLALAGSLLAYQRGRALDWALTGAAMGAACATKYTAGAVALSAVGAALMRWRVGRDSATRGVRMLVVAGIGFAVAFLVMNPFSVLDFEEFKSQVTGQRAQAATQKLGQVEASGWLYYASSLTWGLGWLPALAAVVGGVLALRADRARALLLLLFPLALLLYLGSEGRYFARWLLPAYPPLCILAAYAAVRGVDALRVSRRRRGLVLAALTAALVAQGLSASVRVSAALGRTDTRAQARSWLIGHVPAGTGLVVEPFLPQGFLTVGGRTAPERYVRYRIDRPFQAYEKRLEPAKIDQYRRFGYCVVVTGSHQRELGLRAGLAGARAYYQRLDRESVLLGRFSPYYAHQGPVEFSHDFSFNWYPTAYERPGPLIDVRKLRDCS